MKIKTLFNTLKEGSAKAKRVVLLIFAVALLSFVAVVCALVFSQLLYFFAAVIGVFVTISLVQTLDVYDYMDNAHPAENMPASDKSAASDGQSVLDSLAESEDSPVLDSLAESENLPDSKANKLQDNAQDVDLFSQMDALLNDVKESNRAAVEENREFLDSLGIEHNLTEIEDYDDDIPDDFEVNNLDEEDFDDDDEDDEDDEISEGKSKKKFNLFRKLRKKIKKSRRKKGKSGKKSKSKSKSKSGKKTSDKSAKKPAPKAKDSAADKEDSEDEPDKKLVVIKQASDEEIATYDKKKIKKTLHKFKVKRDHRLILIDFCDKFMIKQCPAYIWVNDKEFNILLIEEEPRHLVIPTFNLREVTYLKKQEVNADTDYPAFKKKNMFTDLFRPYLPDYTQSTVATDLSAYKNLYGFGPGIYVTNRSIKNVFDLLAIEFRVDDKVTMSTKVNIYFKEAYKARILLKDNVIDANGYADKISKTLGDMAKSTISHNEFKDTLNLMMKNKLITQDFAMYYMDMREKSKK